MKYCLNCGKELNNKKSKNTKYCSAVCQQAYQSKQYINRWKNGEETGITGQYQISEIVRKYMLEKADYQCEKCGWHEENLFTKKIPLEIHHKDGNYSHTTEDNLEVLCPNCHALTENFRSRGRGRADREKTYKTNTCIDCGAKITNTSERCVKCSTAYRKKKSIEKIPISREELKKRIREESLSAIGRNFNTSGSSIRCWMKAYNLPVTKKEINKYTDAEWEKL